MASDKEIEKILKQSEIVSQRLNKAILDECESKSMELGAAYYSVARFVAGFIDDIRPVLGDKVLDSFTSTVKDILQAFQDEGKDKTYRLLKYHLGNPDSKAN